MKALGYGLLLVMAIGVMANSCDTSQPKTDQPPQTEQPKTN